MERKYQHVLKHDMPQTPRVSSKIVDYYMKFGSRDLKRFMRLFSPESDSSQNDQKAEMVNKTIPCQQNIDRKMKCSRSNERLKYLEAKPNLEYRKEMSQSMHNAGAIEAMSILDKDLETSKRGIIHPKLAQTPESVAKVHKALEWDSLGDVGYDQLTSNITDSRTSKNSSERISTASFIINRQNAQPLASSTLMDIGVCSGMIPNVHKTISQGTCMTNKRRIDNFSQTKLMRAPLIDKGIQVNLSSSTSIPEGIETPSSFEYIKPDPTKSLASSNGQKKNHSQHDFFANLSDLVQCKVHMEKSVQHSNSISNIQKLQIKFLDNLEGSEENTCHSSTKISSNYFSLLHYAPELDLGVQLICALINGKNITQIQKKELVREIIKRIKRLSGGSDFAWQNNNQPTSGDDNFFESRSICVDSVTEILQRAKTANIVSPNNTVLPGSEQIRNTQSAVPSIQTRRIIFTNPEYESASQSQDSTETTENQKLISSCDLAQPTMRKCLNSMTKSEAEYGRKHRNARLNWIENEIRGLQRLKRLLLYRDRSPIESNTTQNCIHDSIKRKVVIETQPQSKNLYNSVDTESHEKGETKSYKPPEIIKKNKIQEIKLVVDESNGDVVNLNNNLKRTKGRRLETQLIYEKPSDVMTATKQLSVKPRFRNIRNSVIVNEEQLLGDDVDDNHDKTKHREKIGYPTLTCKIKDNNDTLRNLILQRKQNFIELYKNKCQSHYETWKLRQKETGQYEVPCAQRFTDSPLPTSASQKSSDLREEVSSTTASRLTHVIYTSAAMHASSQQVRRTMQQDAVFDTYNHSSI
uniref:Uncharacterized protein n=1 Tax=Glossina pallidipes TaxID=7398 RepID=A0A1A9ZP56_GLOPL